MYLSKDILKGFPTIGRDANLKRKCRQGASQSVMGHQSAQHAQAKVILEKIKYQQERKKSRAVVGAQIYEERKKHDRLKYNSKYKFKYSKLHKVKEKARSYICDNKENETNKIYYSDLYSYNRFESLSNHEWITIESKKNKNFKKKKNNDFNYVNENKIEIEREPPVFFDKSLDNEINFGAVWSLFLILDIINRTHRTHTMTISNSNESKTNGNGENNNVAQKRKEREEDVANEATNLGGENVDPNGGTRKKIHNSQHEIVATQKHKPRYKLRRANDDNTPIINTVLFKLSEDVAKTWESVENMDDKLRVLFELDIKDAKLVGRRLYVTPRTEEDHDVLIRQNKLKVLGTQTIHNKDTHFILKEISYAEIEECSLIQKDLKSMGVEKWSPLFDDGSVESKNDQKVRCKCATRADVSNIMSKYFVSGKRWRTRQNYAVTATFHPDIKNPIQCYKCFSFDGHMAHKCEKLICGKCGDPGHDVDGCSSNKIKCVNCGDRHEARDLRCEVYQNQRIKDEEYACFRMTSEVLIKPRFFKGRRATWATVVNGESATNKQTLQQNDVSYSSRQGKNIEKASGGGYEADEKMEELKRVISREHVNQKEWFETNTKVTEASVTKLDTAAARMSNWCDTIDAKISSQILRECDKVRIECKAQVDATNREVAEHGQQLENLRQANSTISTQIQILKDKCELIENFIRGETETTSQAMSS